MERITKFFLERPLFTNLIVVAVILFGIQTARVIQKESFPRVSRNQILITTYYPGAAARDVEINVTVPIEEALEEVPGIEEFVSLSREGVSQVTVFADEDADDSRFQAIYDEVEAALARVDTLPEGIDGRPFFDQVTSDDIPIVELAVSGPYEKLRTFIPYLERELRSVRGVAELTRVGMPDEEVRILVDPVRARALEIDLRTVAAAIRSRNLEGSGGTLETFLSEKKVVAYTKFQDYREVLDTHLRRSPEGYGVRLRDIAKLEIAPEDRKLIVRSNGKPGASVLIKRKPGTDLLEVVSHIRETVAGLRTPEEVEVHLLNDQSYLARNRLQLLASNSVMGLVFVLALLFWAFDARTAVWTAAGIPFSVLGIFVFLPLLGITLNAITLGGFVMVLGMLVDDAVVVAEQIHLQREQGQPALQAATRAVGRVWRPVFAAAATTMIAFTPMLQLGGLPGKFIWVIPVVVILALSVSLFESYFILPLHLVHGKPGRARKKKSIVMLETVYARLLRRALRYRYLVTGAFVVLLVASVFTATRFITKDPFPQEAAEGLLIKSTLPPGTRAPETIALQKRIEAVLKALPENELAGFSTRIGTLSTSALTERGYQNNLAVIFVYLTPYSSRDRTAAEIMEGVRGAVGDPGSAELVLEVMRLGPPVGYPFEVRVSANGDAIREARVEEIRAFVSDLPGVSDVSDDDFAGRPELNVEIRHDVLARAGLTVEDLLTTLRIAFDGLIVTNMTEVGRSLDFRLHLDDEARADPGFLATLPMMNREGHLINLDHFLFLKEKPGRAEIIHVNGARTTTLHGNLDKDRLSPARLMELVNAEFISDEQVRISFAGEPVENAKIFGDLLMAAGAALLGVYLIIALVFNSLTRPIIVMLSVPFIAIGVVWSLFFHGMALSMFALLGLIGLVGVIVNNAIVLVHTIQEKSQEDGAAGDEAVLTGSVQRLRPVLLTSLTTILGLFPTAYGLGGYDPMISPMCLAMGYGLLFGTLIVMYLVPCLYRMGQDIDDVLSRLQARRGVRLE